MKTGRIIKWVLVLLVVSVGVAAGVGYLLASRIPGDYDPLTLSALDQGMARKVIEIKVLRGVEQAGRIGTYHPGDPRGAHGQPANRSFVVVFTEQELNERVASLTDEEAKPLREAGLSRPAIAIGPDRLTVYAHWDAAGKIVGIDTGFGTDSDGAMQFKVTGIRLGSLPVPERALGKYTDEIITQLQGRINSWLNNLPQGFGKVRIRSITIVDGQIRLDVESRLGEKIGEG